MRDKREVGRVSGSGASTNDVTPRFRLSIYQCAFQTALVLITCELA